METPEERLEALFAATKKGQYLLFQQFHGDHYSLTLGGHVTFERADLMNGCKKSNYMVHSVWGDFDIGFSRVVCVNVGEYLHSYSVNEKEICVVGKDRYTRVDIEYIDEDYLEISIAEFDSLEELARGTDCAPLHLLAVRDRMSRLEAKMDLLLTHLMYAPGGEGAAEAEEHFDGLAG
jgi:hypothetical protein